MPALAPDQTPVARATEWVDAHRDALIEFLCELIRTPSPNPPGEAAAAAVCAKHELRAHGLDVERYDVAGADGLRVPTVLGWLGPRTDRPALVLNAHVDTSPPGDGWTIDPWGADRRDGHVFGRGAVLSKGDVAAYVYAAAAARTVLPGDAATVVVALTADEGTGGELGPRHLLEERGLCPERAICAGVTHQVTIAHDGCIQLRLRIHGAAIHTALARPERETTRLAIALCERVLAADRELRRRASGIAGIGHPTLAVTRIATGAFFGLAPGLAEVWLDRRVVPEEDLDAAATQLRALVDDFAHDAGVLVEVELAQRALPLVPTREQGRWAEVVQAAASAELGVDVPLGGLPLYTDARWFGARGIPTAMYGAGPADLSTARINGADERVAEDDVVTAARVLTRVICHAAMEGRGNDHRAGSRPRSERDDDEA